MKKIISINEYERNANELLEEAMNKNFNTVLIIGITETEVHLDHSMSEDALKVIGSIEALKNHYIKQWS